MAKPTTADHRPIDLHQLRAALNHLPSDGALKLYAELSIVLMAKRINDDGATSDAEVFRSIMGSRGIWP